MTSLNHIDITDVVKDGKSIKKINIYDSDSEVTGREKIASCIDNFKESIEELFEDHEDAESFVIVSNDNVELYLELFEDEVRFHDVASDGASKHLVLDFRTNTLKSDSLIISNIDTLDRLFSSITGLYQDLSEGKATILESNSDN
jgi:hypothetical protein